MRPTISVRLPEEIATWLESTAARSGVSQSQIVRDKLEQARRADTHQPRFMRLAGTMSGPRNLSSRKGYSKQ